jgi:predicted transposase/invertase (TIGR01784 family)
MTTADAYFQPTPEEDALLFKQSGFEQKEEVDMELMPAWKRWGYEEGIEKGIEKGIEQGIEQGIEKGMATVIMKLLKKGFTAEELARTVELPVEHIQKIAQS